MSSVTTGEVVLQDPTWSRVRWASLVLAIQTMALFGSGFIAYGRLDERVQNPPALQLYIRDQHAKEVTLADRMARIESDIKAIKESTDRIERHLADR